MQIWTFAFCVTALIVIVPILLALLLNAVLEDRRPAKRTTIRVARSNVYTGIPLLIFSFVLMYLLSTRAPADANLTWGYLPAFLFLLAGAALTWLWLSFRIDLAEERMHYRSVFYRTHVIRYKNVTNAYSFLGGLMFETKNPKKSYYPIFVKNRRDMECLLEKFQEEEENETAAALSG